LDSTSRLRVPSHTCTSLYFPPFSPRPCSTLFPYTTLLPISGAVGVDVKRQRLRHADRIGELDRAARCEARRDDVLGEVAGDVSRRTIDLGRVLAAERAAPVRRCAAVGVDDDLAAGQARIAVGAADLEAAGRVDVVLGRVGQQLGGENV